MINISVCKKSSNSSKEDISTINGSILLSSKRANFSSFVVEPFKEYQSSNKEIASGFPNQPHPKILTFLIATVFLFYHFTRNHC